MISIAAGMDEYDIAQEIRLSGKFTKAHFFCLKARRI